MATSRSCTTRTRSARASSFIAAITASAENLAALIEERTGRPVSHLCYPWHASGATARELARANLAALQELGAVSVIALNTVGVVSNVREAGEVAVPDQVIDYTWGREHTLFEVDLDNVTHVDFTEPYCAALRKDLLSAAKRAGVPVLDGGTYAATQGPRLESAAEIARLERDGCDIVGMTGMPETSLARELGLDFVDCDHEIEKRCGAAIAARTCTSTRRRPPAVSRWPMRSTSSAATRCSAARPGRRRWPRSRRSHRTSSCWTSRCRAVMGCRFAAS